MIIFDRSSKSKNKTRSDKAINLYGINSHDSQYIFELIEVGFYLEGKNSDDTTGSDNKEIQIELLAYRPGIVSWFKDFTRANVVRSLMMHKSESRKLDSRSRLSEFLNIKSPLMFNLKELLLRSKSILAASRSKSGITFTNQGTKVTIKGQSQNFFHSVAISIKSTLLMVYFYFRCGMPFSYNHAKFMGLNYKSCLIGQVAASVSLNKTYKLSGAYRPIHRVWLNLRHSIALTLNSFSISATSDSYFFPHESTYHDLVYVQSFNSSGRNVVEKFTYNDLFKVWSGKEPLDNFFLVGKSDLTNSILKQLVNDYMDTSIHEGLPSYYPLKGNVNDRSFLMDINEKLTELNFEEVSAVVFMHSFNDGQFIYGYDGFKDIYDWTIQCITNLIANPYVERVFVKPHPHVNYSESRIESDALQNIMGRFKNEKKVVFCSPKSSILLFTHFKKVFGITHHGSIFEEFQYLGKPVIASVFGPWRKNYSFLNLYENPLQLKTIIGGISKSNFPTLDPDTIDELHTYIYNYRVIGVTWESKLITKRFEDEFVWAPNFRSLDFEEREGFFLNMKVCDSRFVQILDHLRNQHPRLCR